MANESDGSGVSITHIVAAVALVSATYFVARPTALQSGRPDTQAASSISAGGESHAWQDPLAALEMAFKSPDWSKNSLTVSPCPGHYAGKTLTVIVPSVGDDDSIEARRRRRFGVTAALDIENYTPTDGKLDVVPISCAISASPDQSASLSAISSSSWPGQAPYPATVSQENLEPKTTPPCTKSAIKSPQIPDNLIGCIIVENYKPVGDKEGLVATQSVRVFWIPEAALGAEPALVFRLLTSVAGNVVLGPHSSNLLFKLAVERRLKKMANKQQGPVPPFFAGQVLDFSATAPVFNDVELQSVSRPDVRASDGWIKRIGVDDVELVQYLRDELELRFNKNTEQHIVLITEWNSTYGARLRACFLEAFSQSDSFSPSCPKKLVSDSKKKPDVWSFDYARGLDDDARSDASKRQTAQVDQGAGGANDQSSETTFSDKNKDDRAEGDRQTDYVLRLAALIKERAGSTSIAAIGLLGNDVYDKRLMLKALRPMFPGSIFFTTDLDARLMERSVLEYTRGVLVASDFLLTLPYIPSPGQPRTATDRYKVQSRTMPFRDTYEAGAYLAARYALHCIDTGNLDLANVAAMCSALADVASKPHLMEIGRFGEALELSSTPATKPLWAHGPRLVVNLVLMALAGALMGALTWVMDRDPGLKALEIEQLKKEKCKQENKGSASSAISKSPQCSQRNTQQLEMVDENQEEYADVDAVASECWSGLALRYFVVVLAAWVLCGEWPGVRALLMQKGMGQSVDGFHWLSLWPVIGCRVAVALLGAWLVLRTVGKLNASLLSISIDFHLGRRSNVVKMLRGRSIADAFWHELSESYNEIFGIFERHPPEEKFPVEEYWLNEHLPRCSRTARYTRSLLYACALFIPLWIWMSLDPGSVVTRGTLVLKCYDASLYCSIGVVLLLSCVVLDATIWSIRLVGKVGMEPASTWPKDLTGDRKKLLGWSDVGASDDVSLSRALADCIDLEFIERRTQTVLPFVYAPFAMLALFVVSQVIGAELCPPTAPVICAECAIGALLAVSVIVLRSHAEAARRYALDKLDEAASRVSRKGDVREARISWFEQLIGRPKPEPKADHGEPTIDQLERAIKKIAAMRSGAFTSFLQQPLVKAFVLPVGAYVVPLIFGLLRR